MQRPVPTAFTEACRALERGELALALLHCDTLSSDFPAAAEPVVLKAFVERRAAHDAEPWFESLVRGWESCGRPTHFTFMKGGSINEDLQAIAVSDARVQRLGELLSEGVGFMPMVWMSNRPEVLLDGAIAQLARSTGTLTRLFAAGQLKAALREPKLLDRVNAVLVPLHLELAEANPAIFELAALPVIDELQRQPRLEPRFVHRLLAILDRDTRPKLALALYRELVERRGAQTGQQRHRAFLDVIAVLPDPAFQIYRRAKADLRHASASMADELVPLLDQLGARESSLPLMLNRMLGLELLRLAAERGKPEALPRIREQLAHARRTINAPQRLNPDWPIEPLLRELVDLMAENEVGVLTRCTAPEPG